MIVTEFSDYHKLKFNYPPALSCKLEFDRFGKTIVLIIDHSIWSMVLIIEKKVKNRKYIVSLPLF